MTRLMQLFAGVLILFAGGLLSTTLQAKTHYGDGFSIDLDDPYDRVLEVVREVAADGIIRGTSEYKGTSELDSAVPQNSSNAFHAWTEGGTILYKVKANTLSPEHFYESNDKGTVTVRYVVKALGPKSTRLWIDAIFVQDSLRHSHASDGTPENAEFLVISDRLKDIADRAAKERLEAATEQDQKKFTKLQEDLDDEKEKLNAAKARQEEVRAQIFKLEGGKDAVVTTASADLKSSPYNGSATLQSLVQGNSVMVTLQTRNWCRVRTADGQEGWIYRLMLQVSQ